MKKKNIAQKGLKYSIMMWLFLFSLQLFSINDPGITKEGGKKDLNNSEWQLYNEFTGIQVYFRSVECHDIQNGIHQQRILLKFVNTTNTDLRISWNMQLWYNDVCLTCNDKKGEYVYNNIIDGGNSIEGICETLDAMNIFLRFLNYEQISKLTNFEMAGVTVSPL